MPIDVDDPDPDPNIPAPPVEPNGLAFYIGKYSLKVVIYFRQIGSVLGCSLKLAMCIYN